MPGDTETVKERLEKRNLGIYTRLTENIGKFREDHPEITGFEDYDDIGEAKQEIEGDVTLKNTKILQFILNKNEISMYLDEYPELAAVIN